VRKGCVVAAVATVVGLALASAASAHHDDGGLNPLEAVTHEHQHGGDPGHLPAVQRNVELVGKLDLFGTQEQAGRISDVGAFGNYAYLGAFREPDCENGGVYVIDISKPSAPRQVGFIPASPFTYVGEGVQVFQMSTAFHQGPVLVHNNENCIPVDGAIPAGQGGASLWDVSNPSNPAPLALHVGDTDPAVQGSLPHTSIPHQSHSAFAWQQGNQAYLVMVDNAELGNIGAGTDVDILDITDPRNPRLIVETGLPDFPEIQESPPPNGNNVFLHDMVVKKVGERYLLLGSYWDGGYIILDVTNLPAKPTFLRDTDFGAVEPFAAQMGLPADWTPEGNAHQAEFNFDNTLFLGADEDFGARRISGTITSGLYQNHTFSATQGSNVPQVDENSPIEGPTTFVGAACGPVLPAPSPSHTALVERGTCTFTIKVQNVQAAGYRAGIVFNDTQGGTGCEAQVFMLAVGDIPFMFVARSTGLKLLNQSFTDPCATATPPIGTPSENVSIKAIFDGWGYLHLFDANTMQDLDQWAIPEALSATHADGFGDLSIHEVATDPARNRAYISYYSGGFRVVEFSRKNGIREVGAFIAPGGNNFWGVEFHTLPGRTGSVVLASDRDSGLWIFRYRKGAR
jgi:hypothetical protein